MRHRASGIRRALAIVVATLFATVAGAQEPPLNMSEVGNYDSAGQSFADVWGQGNLAFLAHFGQSRVDIIDISNPANPQLLSTYNATNGSAQDVKVANGLMFVGLESTSPGIHIVDVRNPASPTKLTNVTVRSAVHNVFFHEGWLYLCDSSAARIDVVDLRNYDPDNAPATISSAKWTVTGIGQFVHDITVQGDRLFASAWNSLQVFDITNIATEAPQFLASHGGTSVHAAWATDDMRYVVVAEERTGGGLKLFEMIESNGPDTLSLVMRDTFTIPTSRATSAHNPVVVGNRVFVSWYQVGVQVLDIDPAMGKFSLVASFDTTAAAGNTGFSGNWGVYPFLGENRILASDTSTGLWVLRTTLGGAPTLSVNGSCPGSVTVTVSGASPNAEVGVISSPNTKGWTKGGQLCNGTLFELSEPFTLPPKFLGTNSSGDGSRSMTLPAGSCNVEAIDLKSCQTTNAVTVE